jgi:hypothetical protein
MAREIEALYADWIKHVFDHPAVDANREGLPKWYHSWDAPLFEVSDEEFLALFQKTMARCGTDLLRFTDAQVGNGLDYVFNPSCSNYIFQLRDGTLAREIKASAILSIAHLYSDCLGPRCKPILGHLNESGGALNAFCYMLWDVTPLTYWADNPDKIFFYEKVIETMAFGLRSTNIACVEGALHGLGHMQLDMPELVAHIVGQYILENPKARKEVLAYAMQARQGTVQ